MSINKRFLLFNGLFSAFALFALTACNSQPQSTDPGTDTDTDQYHEKSFSWDGVAKNSALAKTAEQRTWFNSEEDLAKAVAEMDETLKIPGASDSIWKPIDYACDELALGLWNKYGTISIGDSVVLSESSIKANCRYIGEEPNTLPAALGKSATEPSEAVDRQYPYKMIGVSWSDKMFWGYPTTGGESSFKKYRSKLGFSGWYDTDASRIGVRIHTFNCGDLGLSRICAIQSSHYDWYSNDDEVSKRKTTSVGSYEWRTIPSASNGWTATETSDPNVPRISFKRDAAVFSYHSVDHAGLQFRAISSSGFSGASAIYGAASTPQYVTW